MTGIALALAIFYLGCYVAGRAADLETELEAFKVGDYLAEETAGRANAEYQLAKAEQALRDVEKFGDLAACRVVEGYFAAKDSHAS